MEFIVTREDAQVYDGAKIEFIRDKQIPMLEETGFVRALAREWFWLGYRYFRDNQPEKGLEAYHKVRDILKPSDTYYALIPFACEMEQKLSTEYRKKNKKQYRLETAAEEFRYLDGTLCYWKEERISEGCLNSADRDIGHIFRNSFRCDGHFTCGRLTIGETHTGTDGTTLTFASDCETVETPCGTFEECQLWIIKHSNDYGISTYKSYYKSGIGIDKHEHTLDGLADVRVLKAYHIVGGEGLLPMASGNTWEYSGKDSSDIMRTHLKFHVSYADERSVILSSSEEIERLKYDEDSWSDMIEQIRNEYWKEENDRDSICDVSKAVQRAEILAKTPMEKAHTKAACSVARRIMETDATFNPDYTATGHWNFFAKYIVQKKKDLLTIHSNFRWSFEWKNTGSLGDAGTPLLYNDIYGILQDAANCIWSDDWRVGASPLVEYMMWDTNPIKTQIMRMEEISPRKQGHLTIAWNFLWKLRDCMRVCLTVEEGRYIILQRVSVLSVL